jgi:adenylate cyclase
MGEGSVERRLAAILAADVVGYSRLMEANEERTLASLKKHRAEFFDPTILKHDGRLFKVMGDGFLIEYASVLDALRCGVDVQAGMMERNQGEPEDRQIKFRIGINLGDVIIEGDDIYGNGVNMAARLEGLARPGGIACSATVFEHARGKLDLEFLDQGEHQVKNIAQPVQVYSVDPGQLAETSQPLGSGLPPLPKLPDKPSIAVLPFENMSNDPEQEFFSDGITEDIITDLSQISGLFVLARNTVFTHKGKPINVRRAAKQLGVSHVVEGSVRKAGSRVRINAQLIDGATGGHVWASRYDGTLDGIFELQDEITYKIVSALKVSLLPEEQSAIAETATQNVDAYTFYLRGREHQHAMTMTDLVKAHQMFAQAIELDTAYARAYAGIADCKTLMRIFGDREVNIDEILKNSAKAIELDGRLAEAHASHGFALLHSGQSEDALAAFETALELDPASYEVNYFFGTYCRVNGIYERGIELFERASEVNPDEFLALTLKASLCSIVGRTNDARSANRQIVNRTRRALSKNPEDEKAAILCAIALANLGRENDAREMAALAEKTVNDSNGRYNLACVYARLGDSPRALDFLEISVPDWPAVEWSWVWEDPDLISLHGDERFSALKARLSQ